MVWNDNGHTASHDVGLAIALADHRRSAAPGMAVGLLRADEQVVFDDAGCLFLGELGLDGTLRHTSRILPMVALARERGITTVFVPAVDAAEAALVEGVA